LIHRAAALALAGLILAACGGGYETVTPRGEGVKEWFLEVPGGRIEALAIWPPGRGPHPALLLIHAAEGRAQRFRRTMFDLAREGLFTMSISLPGFGESTGPEDFAGPRSVEAVVRAADHLARRSEVRPEALAVYGYGQGAAAALLAAARNPCIRLAAVEDGVYDLEKAFEHLPAAERERLRLLLGATPEQDPEPYRLRSALLRAGEVRGPILIIHSRRARAFPPAQAELLAEALKRQNRPHRLTLSQGASSGLDPKHPSLKRWVVPFMKEHLPFK